jgi:hypothetical protein
MAMSEVLHNEVGAEQHLRNTTCVYRARYWARQAFAINLAKVFGQVSLAIVCATNGTLCRR